MQPATLADIPRIVPFLKWAGGKSQLIEQLFPLMPQTVDRYLEPFVGGGAVFLFVKSYFQPKEILLFDTNEELVNCYQTVQQHVEELISLLEVHKLKHSETYYYETRSIDTSTLSAIERAARLLYLNKTCFNGLYRVNSKGNFNVPVGRYANPNIVNEGRLRQASILLQGVRIEKRDFGDIVPEAQPGDFIYLDPPYYPLSATASFTSYTSGVFLEDEQRRLAKVYQELDKKGCFVMQSNSDTPLIRRLYDKYNPKTVLARRAINSKAEKRGAITELAILNYEVTHDDT